jgi:hypothetical protein
MANDRFLLIKAWSYILWADVEHVLSQILIAELTDRTPVVYWPTHCIHNGYVHTNGFELYFEPVSNFSIFDVAKPEYTYYPPVWDSDNLLADDPDRETWVYRNLGDMMTRTEDVLVGDVYFDMYTLIPFIKKSHPAYGMTVRQIFRYLFRKYIRVKPDIDIEIQGFYNSWLRESAPVLAVHVCKPESNAVDLRTTGKDAYKFISKSYRQRTKDPAEKKIKISWFPWKRNTLQPNQAYHKEIKKYIDLYNVKKIFLLTNSKEVLKEYQGKYGDMVVATQCRRTTAYGGPSYLESPMVKRRQGIEIVKDTYLASMCEYFIGNDFSSLSQAVVNSREWVSSNVSLLYWKIRKRKYPINMKITFRERKEYFRRLKDKWEKRFRKN